jgi:OmpA-OmpF porin, OOP family
MNKIIIAGILSLNTMVAFAQSASTPVEQGFVIDSENHAVVASDGSCVRTGTYDPATAYHPDCTPIAQVQPQPAPVVNTPEPVAPPPVAPKELTVYFAFDSTLIRPEQAQKIDDFIQANGLNGNLTIIAGADFIGSTTYNQKLSERRAQSIAAYLNHKYAQDGKTLNIVKEEGVGKSEAKLQDSDQCKPLLHNRRKLIECIAPDRFGTISIESPNQNQ